MAADPTTLLELAPLAHAVRERLKELVAQSSYPEAQQYLRNDFALEILAAIGGYVSGGLNNANKLQRITTLLPLGYKVLKGDYN